MKRTTKGNILSIKKMTCIGIWTALTCILAPLSIPIGVVPLSLTNVVLLLGVYVLGTRLALGSCLVYLLLGTVGLPVFSGFSGGPQRLVGPTGGYLLGFILMILVAGIFIEKSGYRRGMSLLGMVLGTILCYGIGTGWLVFQTKLSWEHALTVGVLPFIPGDGGKIAVVVLVAPKIRKALARTSAISF